MNTEEVEHLVERGRERGYVTAEDIAEILAEVDLTTDQIEAIYTRLLDLGIDVSEDDAAEPDEPDEAVADKAALRAAGLRSMSRPPSTCPPRTRCACISRRSAGSPC